MLSHDSVPIRARYPMKAVAVAVAVSLGLMSISDTSLAQDTEIEEVIVTGSFIRRSEGFIDASPVVQMSAEEIEAQGTVNLGQMAQNMTFNQGSSVTSGIEGGASDTSSSFNLRGLGANATLTLLDGKRVASQNVNNVVPSIALQRVDIVTDGAAALYGTDAVAGVVNLVPYRSYDGLKVEYFGEMTDSGDDFTDQQISLLGGTTISGNIDIVGAATFRDHGELRWHDRPDHLLAGLTQNSGPNWSVPLRDADGRLTDMSVNAPEPSCGLVVENPAEVGIGANPYGVSALGRCWADFGDQRNFRNKQTFSQFYGGLTWSPTDDFSLNIQGIHGRQITNARSNPANSGARVDRLPTVRGEQPGNPFRAISSNGQELFAVPMRNDAGHIVTDAFGQPLPVRNEQGQVQLAPNQFASLEHDPQGGVPFNEDVNFGDWNIFHKAHTLPSWFASDGVNVSDSDSRNSRIAITADFSVPFLEGWEGTTYYTWSQNLQKNLANQAFSLAAISQGLECDVINDAGACFNPFMVTDDRFYTAQNVADQIAPRYRGRDEESLQTFDFILNGEIGGFELPGGFVGAAVGYQRREEAVDVTPPLLTILEDVAIGNHQLPRSASRHVDAYFVELAVPVLDTLHLSGAVRNEKFSTSQSDTVGKVGVIYRPLDWLALRGTWGQAFIAPSLNQLQAPEACGLTGVDDPFTSFQGYVSSCNRGNPNLLSETSDSVTLGVDMIFNNLRVSVNWGETDFADRIVNTSTQDILRTDFANFQAATGFSGGEPSLAQVEQWIADPRSDQRIVRAPGDVSTVRQIIQSSSNASNMLVRAWDIQGEYSFSMRDWGDFRLILTATMMDTYQFKLTPADPVLEAVGNQNGTYGAVPAMPKWRANGSLIWVRGNHMVNTTVRYVDEVKFDGSEYSFQQFFPFTQWKSTSVIRAWTQADIFYSYRGVQVPWLDGELTLAAGARNMFDRAAQRTGMIAGVVADLQDPLGRVLYGRLAYDF